MLTVLGGPAAAPVSPSEIDRFLAALELPFTSPTDRALKMADALDQPLLQAAFQLRAGDMAGAIAAHYAALVKAAGGQRRLVLESLIQMADRDPGTTTEARTLRQDWWDTYGHVGPLRPLTNDPDPARPPVVGYVSSNFKHSSAGNCLQAIVLRHSSAVRVICYDTNPPTERDPDSWMFQLLTTVVNVSDLSEAELFERMRADGVDIAIDCMGFTFGNRLGTFARRAAPIQLTGLGYATGTIPEMDGILLDPITAGSDAFYERVHHLPCVISYAHPVNGPAVAPQPTGPVTFGAFHCFIKINDPLLALWARLLDAVPGSRIVFKGREYGEPMLRDRIASVLGAARVAFWPQTQILEHHDAFRHVDLVLDPFPQTGGITTCEALHMGVPSVTLLGERTIQRAAATILTAVGFAEGVARTEDEYIAKAAELVTTRRAWLAEQRPLWRERLAASTVCAGYVEAYEQLLINLWREWCATQ